MKLEPLLFAGSFMGLCKWNSILARSGSLYSLIIIVIMST